MRISREIPVKRTAEDIFTIFRCLLAISPASNSKIIEFEEDQELQKLLPKTIPVGESILMNGELINFWGNIETSKKRRKKNKPSKPLAVTILKYNENKEVTCRIQQRPFIDATVNLKLKTLGSLTKLELLAHIRLPWFLKPFGFIFTKLANKFDDGEWLTEIKDLLESPDIEDIFQLKPTWLYAMILPPNKEQ